MDFWHCPVQQKTPSFLDNPSHISGAVTRMGHHLHQRKDSWNCVVRLLCYLSQQQQNQGQNKLKNNVMAVITYLDNIIVIVNGTWSWVRVGEPWEVLWVVKWLQPARVTNQILKNPKWWVDLPFVSPHKVWLMCEYIYLRWMQSCMRCNWWMQVCY